MSPESLPPVAILAGGLGTRMRSVAGDMPKVLLPVGGRPFLVQVLERLAAQGVRDVVLCLGHRADVVEEMVRKGTPAGMRLDVSREPEPLGTGGAVRLALDRLPGTFFLLNGDTYCGVELADLLRRHREEDAILTLTLVASERAEEKGTVAVDASGRVTAFREKAGTGAGLINAGVYALESRLLADRPPGSAFSLEHDVIPAALDRGERVAGHVTQEAFVDIGLPRDYASVRGGLPGRTPA